MKRTFTLVAAALLFATALPVSAQAATTSNPYGTSTVDPAGPNEVIFTVSKGSKKVTFTAAKLASLKTSNISLYEPFVKKRESFTVIPIKSFFDLVGITSKDNISTVALNDYKFDAPAKKFLDSNAYIAIARDGKPISYDEGGPIRIVFADSSSWKKNLDAWNWSLMKLVVKA